jgi:hypothetical protein
MPNQWDLTGENIENTYQRVLQTPDGVNIYDGTGSLFTVTAVAAPAGPDQSVQFNDAGTTSGSGNFTFDKINNIVNLTGSFIIDTASSDAALRVTQTGTGNAILVEDSTNPDSTPFVVTATGNVGIGLTNPSAPLHTKGQFFLGTGGSNANQGAFNWFTANNTYTFRNSPNGDRGLQIGVNVLLDGAGGTAGAVISPVAATGGAGLVLNGSTLGTSNTTLSSSKDLVITSTGNIGLGINTPSYKLDVSGSARVTSSLYLPGLTSSPQANVVLIDTSSGQLYYTSSTAFGGGLSTPTFPFTGSAIITGSLVITGSTTSTLGFTGSLFGTASWADSASQALTASYSTTASYALNGGVTQIQAGPGIFLSPTNGLGVVEITSTAGSYNTATGSYGSFYDTSSQLNPVGNVPRSMSFNATDISNGVSISGSTNPYNTYIKTENAGVYDIQFSAQVEKTDSGTDEIIIWLRKNGIDLIDTATTMTLVGNSTKVVAAWNWFVTSAANDYYQIIWISADTGMRLLAETISATHPGIPSVILTVNRVDQFLSNTGSFSGSFTGQLIGTASWADSASQALTASFYQETDPIFVAKSASLATTGSNTFVGNQVVSGSFIIETASSAATLRVTQLGSGEAIRVEDSTTPDSTAFIVDSSGSVGIGTFAGNTVTAPLYPLHVIAPSGVDARMVFDGKQLGNAAANANITIAADTDDKVASLSFLDRNSTAYSGTSTYNGPVVGFLLDRSGSSNPLATGNRRNDFHIYSGFANRSIIFYTSASDGNTSVNVPGKPRLAITGSNIGINTTSPKVALHVISGSSSGASIQTSDTAVFESNANTYVSIYSPTASNAAVHFGSGGTGGDALGAYIRWNQGNNLMTLGTANDGDDINFVTGNETSSMYLKNNIGLGIGTTDPLYRLHVRNGAVTNSSTFAGSVGVFENSASNAFVSILSHTGYSSGVGFGSNVHRSSARLAWTHDSLNFSLSTNTGSAFLTFGTDAGTERMRITSGGLVGIGTTIPSALLHVSSSTQENGAIIEVSSSLTASAALRVTQVGSGNAILVEDSTNPDSTPFVVTATGNVGIGLTNPSAPLHTKGQFFLGTGGSNANQGAFNWFTANNTYTFRNSPNGDRGLQIGVNVLLDGAGGTAGAVISPVSATGGAGLVLNGSTLGTSNTTLSSSKDLVITSTGNIGLGINTPSYKLDVSGSARVTSSLFLPGLTTTAQSNVVTVDITTGQLYYTASTAFGGGSSTPAFPFTGSAIITGSLVVTGSTTSTLGFTGSLFGTASWADSASQALSASYVLSSSYASVNLQQVTDQGNITTNNILIGSNDSVGIPYLGFWDEDEEDYGRLYFFNNEFRITDYAENPFVSFGTGTITIPGGLDPLATSTIYSPYNNVSRNINLPDQDGTLVLSVNGTTADTSGSITLTTVPTASYINALNQNVVITGSISSLNTTASQEIFSSASYVSGDIIQGTIGGGVTIYDLIYLDTDGTWKDVSQTTTSSTKMLGIYIGGDQILIDGNISSTTDGVGSPIGPSIQNPDQGLPVYIDPGPSSQFNTTIPTSNYIRTLGYLYYNNTSNASNWILKFRPSTDWYKI